MQRAPGRIIHGFTQTATSHDLPCAMIQRHRRRETFSLWLTEPAAFSQIKCRFELHVQAMLRGNKARRSLFEARVLAPILAAGFRGKAALQQAR